MTYFLAEFLKQYLGVIQVVNAKKIDSYFVVKKLVAKRVPFVSSSILKEQ
jgi:hypothetical protein